MAAGTGTLLDFRPMTRALTLLLAGTLATTSCGGHSRHPGQSIGIEGYRGVKDLYPLAEAQRRKHGLPALGLGIVRDGKTIGLGMAGERRSGSGDWATLGDRFDVASCAKSVTATVAAMLVEKGVVRWDMTVKEVFPEMRQSIHPAYADVTLEMLLRHRSGLDRWMSTNDRWTAWHRDHANADARQQRRLFAATVLENPPRHAPGADAFYAPACAVRQPAFRAGMGSRDDT
jgi:CubicO group peptidase (beta-lactamase class C family)